MTKMNWRHVIGRYSNIKMIATYSFDALITISVTVLSTFHGNIIFQLRSITVSFSNSKKVHILRNSWVIETFSAYFIAAMYILMTIPCHWIPGNAQKVVEIALC
ncbi:hypothetical protein WUBG_09089 [Wuchereria bancrofti]|uniref:Uncharacterized protein n=1 Tax=Wuchereria bancrofti TaxID=6293 RepID=J9ESC4_WUCBA|nr:hypothetical protein WUBG_09089 [Wuchereria bancrofti]